jgi:polyphosphate:AMP phosphotransferase
MFESATLEHKLDKATFKTLENQLRADLIAAQDALADNRRRSLLVLVTGPDGAGKGQVLNRLYEWLDARHLSTMAYGELTEDERLHPLQWRFWRDLPPYGDIGVVLGSWYHDILSARATGQISREEFSGYLGQVNDFEAMLGAERVMLLKILLHLDDAESRRRLKAARKNGVFVRPVVREWGAIDTRKERERISEAALEMARVTSTGAAPWHVVPAADDEYRDIAVGRLLLDALRRADAPLPPEPVQPSAPSAKPARRTRAKVPAEVADLLPSPSILSSLDLTQSLPDDEYHDAIREQQVRLTELTTSKAFRKRGLICVFEGNDAAGKGGAIRRVRQALDPRQFRVFGIAAPTDEEKARPYLWRFWRNVPRRGQIAFFDRSWYGRVLVERVEGFCSRDDWERAYGEINGFEDQLTESGYVIVKLWLAISAEEQLKRFKEREDVAFKRYKITPEDWRNRRKWPLYEAALTDMIDRTSTPYAPWTLVEANDKKFARVKVLTTIADALDEALD